jgi:NarL family two-component system response regulator YdfI
MRVVLVGTPNDRARLLARLPEGIDVVGEAPSLERARDAPGAVDAWLIAAPSSAAATPDDDEGELTGAEPLTSRELEVVGLLALGLSNKSIAARLGISDQTVKFHVASIYGKLGASNRTDAARRALRRGLIAL